MKRTKINIGLIFAGIILFPLLAFSQSKEELEKEKRQAQKQIEITNKLLNILKALGHENRLRILNLVSQKELCVYWFRCRN